MDVEEPDDVGVVTELLEENNFPERPLGVRLVPERVEYLLDGHHPTRPTALTLWKYLKGEGIIEMPSALYPLLINLP